MAENIPVKGGWYLWSKDGLTRFYYLKPMGFTHSLLPDCVLFAQDSPDATSGKNIICAENGEFQNCEWTGPLSKPPEIELYESITNG